MQMRVLIATLGSAGDVHPLLAIAQSLRLRGHQVELISPPCFEPMARQLGVEFHPVGTAEHYARTLAHPKLWHPIDGLGVMWRGMIKPAIAPVYERIEEAARRGKITVLASPIVFGARLAQEKLGIPLVTAYTAATMVRSVRDPLTIAQWRVPSWLPGFARSMAWKALDQFKLEPMARPTLDAMRHDWQLDPLSEPIFGSWMHSPDAGVTLFPDWFAAQAVDWPRQIEQAGFPLFDGDGQGVDEPALQAFLDQGPPPVVFAPGTATVELRAFLGAAVSACESLGIRGVMICNDASQLPANLPRSTHVVRYAPFSWLLPRSRALVHHGGIGSCAQALQAGIPQVAVPRGYDQFDNAWRIERLGVGQSIRHQDFDGTLLAATLGRLLSSDGVAQAARGVRQRIDPMAARNTVCDVVERFR
jgi:rhamnosyltransferase subunit B